MNSVIGIVSCGLDGGRQFVTDTYIRAMETAGGIPLVIPCCQEACCPTFTRLCQGFLFCGGDDVSPLLFGEEPLTGQGRTDWNTDWFHLNFMRQVLKAGLPVLGICRGMQILNLALGGTIWQDLSLPPVPRCSICRSLSAAPTPLTGSLSLKIVYYMISWENPVL